MQQILQDLNDDFFLDNTPSDIERQIESGHVDESSISKKWIGYPPVTIQDIIEKERLLGMTFPPSYKRFLLTSNGFRNISPFIYRLLSLQQIDWAKNTEEQWWLDMCAEKEYDVSDEDYFDYSDEQDSVNCRAEYILESLKISEWGDAMCVYLNPVVKHGDEWEVLEYASWFPGIRRYKSFEEFLIKIHKTNVFLRNDK
jgi:cell wall assembly regulator SMI1